jgi:PAS domain S-box-containing protein
MVDPDDDRLVKIVHMLTLVTFFALFLPTVLRWHEGLLRPILVAISVEQLALVVAFLLNRSGKVRPALMVILFSLMAMVTFMAAVSDDGVHDVVIMAMPALVVAASILLDRKVFLTFTVVTILVYAALTGAEVLGWLTSNLSQFTTLYDVIEGSLILAITAFAVGLLIRNMQSSLDRAKKSEAALGRSHGELQRQSQKLSESEARYRLVVESAQEPIVSTDINGRFAYVNSAAAKLAGYAIEDLIGREFFEFCLPEHRSSVRRAFLRQFHLREPSRSYEVALRSRKGRIHWLSMNVTLELREGSLTGFHVVARDITDRRAAEDEVRRLNQQLELRVHERTSELESTMLELQRISYTVSHDLRAPLRHISAYAEMSQNRPAVRDDAFAHKYLQTIAFSAKWMGMLVDGLIEYLSIGQTELQRSRVEIGQLVSDVREQLKPEMSGRTIEWKVGPLPVVEGDRRLLRQAIANLLNNAVKFTHGRPHAVIEVGSIPCEPPMTEYRLFVRDNGIGFDPQYQDRLFGLFERLHSRAEYSGAGIGLANVRRIIHRHGGRIWADGVVDGGATFTFTLPVQPKAEQERSAAADGSSTSATRSHE